MPMREDMKTAAYGNADGAGADEDFIVIEIDTGIDRCCFLLSIFVRVCLNIRVLFYLKN